MYEFDLEVEKNNIENDNSNIKAAKYRSGPDYSNRFVVLKSTCRWVIFYFPTRRLHKTKIYFLSR